MAASPIPETTETPLVESMRENWKLADTIIAAHGPLATLEWLTKAEGEIPFPRLMESMRSAVAELREVLKGES